MIVLGTPYGKQIYDPDADAWMGTLSGQLNLLCTRRTLDIPTAMPDKVKGVINGVRDIFPDIEILNWFYTPDPGERGRVY
jgi:hypothetical protein